MSKEIWLKPKGRAVEVYEGFRQSYIASHEARSEFAAARGASGYLSHFEGALYGLIFKGEPESLSDAYRHDPNNPHSRHAYVLRSPRLKKYRDAVLAERDLINQIPLPQNLDDLSRGLGLPLSYEYKKDDGNHGWGRVTNGRWTSWNPTWDHLRGTIFILGVDLAEIRARHEAEGYEVTFDTGDGTIPGDLFEVMLEHQVVYAKGEEKIALEREDAAKETANT